jgi:cathepsin D
MSDTVHLSFNLGEGSPNSSQCVGALAGTDFGLGNNVWLLGDSSVANYACIRQASS